MNIAAERRDLRPTPSPASDAHVLSIRILAKGGCHLTGVPPTRRVGYFPSRSRPTGPDPFRRFAMKAMAGSEQHAYPGALGTTTLRRFLARESADAIGCIRSQSIAHARRRPAIMEYHGSSDVVSCE